MCVHLEAHRLLQVVEHHEMVGGHEDEVGAFEGVGLAFVQDLERRGAPSTEECTVLL